MKQSHQNSVLFCESDLYALMQPDARKLLALSDEVDFPALRGQFRGENLPEIYRRLSEIAGADLMPLCETERQLRQKMRIPADGEQPPNHQQKRFLRENYAHLTTFTGAYEAERFLGLRAIQAMQLRNMTPGYAALGAYLFSQAMWLAWEVRQNGYARVNFLARDGYFVKVAFERLNEVLRLPVETGYVRISRQAALPLQFPKTIDLLSLPLLIDMTAHTPDSLLTLLHPIATENARAALAAELPMNQRMDARTQWNFVRIFREKGYDAEKYQQYEKNAKAYLLPMFAGKCATFDVGYNLRSETVIQRLTGADVTAYITHIDSDLPMRRGVPFRTLYGTSPYVSWVAREQFLLERGAATIGYDAHGAVLGQTDAPSSTVQQMQTDAMRFVADMADTFGARLMDMHFRPQDGCAAFEHFLHTGAIQAGAEVENAFLDGQAGGDPTRVQWRLMQTDAEQARHPLPKWMRKLQRAAIRLAHDPQSIRRKL